MISINLQPQHAAILEGEQEIFLTEQQFLPENFNGIPLFIRPQGFFQTNLKWLQVYMQPLNNGWLNSLFITCGIYFVA